MLKSSKCAPSTAIKQGMSPNVRASAFLKLEGAEEGACRYDMRCHSERARHFVFNEELARISSGDVAQYRCSAVQQERPIGIFSSVYSCEIGRTFQLADWCEGL